MIDFAALIGPTNVLTGTDMAPYLAEVVTGMGLMRSGLFLTSLLLAAAVGYFYITRPLLSDEPEPALLPQACA